MFTNPCLFSPESKQIEKVMNIKIEMIKKCSVTILHLNSQDNFTKTIVIHEN